MHYDTTKAHYIVVTVILKHNNTYLILKRAPTEKAFPNLWCVPGGKLETTDYKNREKDTKEHWYNVIETAAIREVKEETGIILTHLDYLTSIVYERTDGIPVLIISMYAETDTTTVTLDKGHTDAIWEPFENLKNYELVDGLYEEYELLEKRLKGKKELWTIKDIHSLT